MAECKDCIHYCVCSPYTAPNESFPEVDGCKCFCAADVVPKSEVEWLYKQVDCLSQEVMYNDDIAKMKVDEAKAERTKDIFNDLRGYLAFNAYGIALISYRVFADLEKKHTEGCYDNKTYTEI